jgi:hypothetical protein
VRLVALWSRTRRSPELLIGLGVLGIGPCGFAFAVFSSLLTGSRPLASQLLWGVAVFAMNLGGAATYVFTWSVFRRSEAWARALVWSAGALFLATFLADGWLHHFRFPGDVQGTLSLQLSGWLRIGALGWGAGESLRYYAIMRRRAALGLADPVVQNRFLLWGLGIGAAAWGSLVATVVPLATGVPSLEMTGVQLSSSLHGLAAAVAMWLAFLPPAWYLRRFEAPSAAS